MNFERPFIEAKISLITHPREEASKGNFQSKEEASKGNFQSNQRD